MASLVRWALRRRVWPWASVLGRGGRFFLRGRGRCRGWLRYVCGALDGVAAGVSWRLSFGGDRWRFAEDVDWFGLAVLRFCGRSQFLGELLFELARG